jgi:hypothetical protein
MAKYPLPGTVASQLPRLPAGAWGPARFCRGNSPCQVFARCLPPGVNSSPRANSAPSSPHVAFRAVGVAPVRALEEAPPFSPVAQVDRARRRREHERSGIEHVRRARIILPSWQDRRSSLPLTGRAASPHRRRSRKLAPISGGWGAWGDRGLCSWGEHNS